MDKDYALKNETNDYLLLEDFNKVLKLDNLEKMKEKHHTDASGKTKDGKILNIELKRRFVNLMPDLTLSGRTFTATTLFIEQHKILDLYLDYFISGLTPIYINFLNDDMIMIHNLTKLSNRTKTQTMRIESKLYQSFEMAKRIELPVVDAWIYKKDENNEYKLIYKPNV